MTGVENSTSYQDSTEDFPFSRQSLYHFVKLAGGNRDVILHLVSFFIFGCFSYNIVECSIYI